MGCEHVNVAVSPREPLSLQLSETLGLLISDQCREIYTPRLNEVDVESFGHLIKWFVNSEKFAQMYSEAYGLFSVPRTEQQISWVKRHFAGQAFQYMAHIYLLAKQQTSTTILSPDRTIEYYQCQFPNKRKHYPFGLDTLYGISVPDGLAVEVGEDYMITVGVCEYTLVKSIYLLGKRVNKWLSNQNFPLPAAIPEVETILVTPKMDRKLSFLPKHRFNHVQVPFSHLQFGRFCRSIFSCYRPDNNYDYPTLDEFQVIIGERGVPVYCDSQLVLSQ